jgi:hypothetical protein
MNLPRPLPLFRHEQITHVLLYHMRLSFAFLVRASFANKWNSITGGLGLKFPVFFCVEPEISPCVHQKFHTNIHFLFLRRLK